MLIIGGAFALITFTRDAALYRERKEITALFGLLAIGISFYISHLGF
ncbi:hypothetical protein [Robertmurraya sp. FSL R5-0851]